MTTRYPALIVAAASSLLVTGAAIAQGRDGPGDSRWFVTTQHGEADYDVTLESDAEWWGRIDERSTTHSIGGGYRILPNLSVRAMYEWARGTDAQNVCPPAGICPAVAFTESTDTDALSVVAMPRWRFARGWDVYGTAGVIGWRAVPDVIGRDRGVDALLGAGVEYEFPSGVAVALEYQQTVFSPDLDYDTVRLGLSYTFGH